MKDGTLTRRDILNELFKLHTAPDTPVFVVDSDTLDTFVIESFRVEPEGQIVAVCQNQQDYLLGQAVRDRMEMTTDAILKEKVNGEQTDERRTGYIDPDKQVNDKIEQGQKECSNSGDSSDNG